MTDNDKMLEAFDACPLHDGYHDDRRLGENRTWFRAGWEAMLAWQAAQAVPPKPDYSVTQLQRMKSLMGELGLATDESLEAFCLDADRQLSRVITAMEKFMAKQSVPVVGEPVAWFYEDPFSGNYLTSEQISCNDIPLYFAPATCITQAELERLRKDAERYRWLRDNKSHTFSVGRDDLHKPNYMTAAQFIEDDPLNYFKEYGDKDELKAMIETDTIWGLQVYPDTPIGFYVWHGATLDYVIDAAIAAEGEK